MDLDEAYKELKLDKEASEEKLEEVYMLWIKRQKSEIDRNISKNDQADIEVITKAYTIIKNHFLQNRMASVPVKGKFKKSLEHILYYYKQHILAFGVITVLVVYVTSTIIESRQEQAYLASLPNPDLSIAFYGEFRNIDTAALEKNILSIFPDWERVEFTIITSPIEMNTHFEIGEQQTSIISLMQDTSDIYIVDKYHYEILLNEGGFHSMDYIEPFIVENWQEERLLYEEVNSNGQKELFGINITSHSIFNRTGVVPYNENIITIHSRSENEIFVMEDFIRQLISVSP
ncbi:hypothetical protein [Evansella cellulosilytica]|uniref:J domain-containing protein n=1 Tax=Evansella cellulosilytica (strain ATCC 21833 / DSM 2522 / FERM P-1141 / JCM 9156 / N-4) TaxID=649639 RepID=E6TQN3_EVAC2|nr:hypothetical protein [Evansella cellulosilytica]ADU30544.1 hypothetical protein Bcell_2284 [Evansella cellulosilytica DSM 2522]